MSHLGHKSFALGIRSSNSHLQEKTQPALDSLVLIACADPGGAGCPDPPPRKVTKL